MNRRIIIVGGGAAGFFAACACARPGVDVTILEKGTQFLSKVRVSGGGRCNLTNACFDERELSSHYPRGERALRGAFKLFQPRDTMAWFQAHGVVLKTEAQGRVFPSSDSSQTIIDCLIEEARHGGVALRADCGVDRIEKRGETFHLTLRHGEQLDCERILLATGGCRTLGGELAVSLGHTLEEPVSSLFTFQISQPWVTALAGVTMEDVQIEIPGSGLRQRGGLLLTHWGLSGPAILQLSAWGARKLHALNYQFPLALDWLPRLNAEQVDRELSTRRENQPAKLVVNTPIAPLTARLWEALVAAAGIGKDTRWADVSNPQRHRLAQQLRRTELSVAGKSTNKEEFVTCGGIRLSEVDFKTMESRLCPGLHFAGELLDIDGLTGGFNFQAAWTTGWIAAQAMIKGMKL